MVQFGEKTTWDDHPVNNGRFQLPTSTAELNPDFWLPSTVASRPWILKDIKVEATLGSVKFKSTCSSERLLGKVTLERNGTKQDI